MHSTAADLDHYTTEFIRRPDIRTISALFLGWTFFLALQYLLIHLWHHFVPVSIRGNLRIHFGVILDLEDEKSDVLTRYPSPIDDTSSLMVGRNTRYLGFLLNLSIAAATIGCFVSLLAFTPVNGVTSCGTHFSFIIAWAGLTGQGIRATGFAQLTSELSAVGISKTEFILLWICNVVSIALSFVVQGLGGGFTIQVPEITDLVLCYKSHPLAAATVSGAANIAVELYILTRLYILIVPEFLRAKHRREALLDARFARAFSLLLLDVLTIIPSMIPIDVAADTIPFSLGAVMVLMAFNYRPLIPQEGINGSLSTIDISYPVSRRPTATTTMTSNRSMRSAMPGDGGYGFEGNVKLLHKPNGIDSVRRASRLSLNDLPVDHSQGIPPVPGQESTVHGLPGASNLPKLIRSSIHHDPEKGEDGAVVIVSDGKTGTLATDDVEARIFDENDSDYNDVPDYSIPKSRMRTIPSIRPQPSDLPRLVIPTVTVKPRIRPPPPAKPPPARTHPAFSAPRPPVDTQVAALHESAPYPTSPALSEDNLTRFAVAGPSRPPKAQPPPLQQVLRRQTLENVVRKPIPTGPRPPPRAAPEYETNNRQSLHYRAIVTAPLPPLPQDTIRQGEGTRRYAGLSDQQQHYNPPAMTMGSNVRASSRLPSRYRVLDVLRELSSTITAGVPPRQPRIDLLQASVTDLYPSARFDSGSLPPPSYSAAAKKPSTAPPLITNFPILPANGSYEGSRRASSNVIGRRQIGSGIIPRGHASAAHPQVDYQARGSASASLPLPRDLVVNTDKPRPSPASSVSMFEIITIPARRR